MTEVKNCRRCSLGFYPTHGNNTVCPTCKATRETSFRRGVTPTYGPRYCDQCGRGFEATAAHQRFCGQRCRRLGRTLEVRRYAQPAHRNSRARWTPIVRSGLVRCHRGAACKRAERINGVLLGGVIKPGEPWDLGHPDSENPHGGPEHRVCNRGAPSRFRAREGRA